MKQWFEFDGFALQIRPTGGSVLRRYSSEDNIQFVDM